jgi:cysteine protease ATG4
MFTFMIIEQCEFIGRCYHHKMTPLPSMEASTTELTDMMTKSMTLIDNKMHEEQPTSSEIYLNSPTSPSTGIDECAIEPAEETGQDVAGNYEDGLDGFKNDFVSRLWMTYRKDFEALSQTNDLSSPTNQHTIYNTDCGWGCMIRSGQMMLAQALVIHFLGRSWRYDDETQIYSTTEDHIHRKIIRWFGDQTSRNSPFSLHKIVELGKASGKKVGEWYGPGAVAHLLKQAVKEAAKVNLDLSTLHVYVAQDCTVYSQDIFDECYSCENVNVSQNVPWNTRTSQKSISTWKSLVLLIPLRLGNEKLNPIYSDCLKAMLSLEWCIGIIGGRPKHSLYFVGYQDDKLIHLDPHYCQEFVDVNNEHFPLSSFHCKSPRKMKISRMDPSCCLGFYISSRQDYERFQNSVQPYLLPVQNFIERKNQNCVGQQHPQNFGIEYNYPMFVFGSGRLKDQKLDSFVLKSIPSNYKSAASDDDDDEDDGIEDFVFI